jgi:zinc protease
MADHPLGSVRRALPLLGAIFVITLAVTLSSAATQKAGPPTPADGRQEEVPPTPTTSGEEEGGTNPFAGFETLYLSNGLRVWYQRLPDEPDVHVRVTVPYGSDSDWHGKEQIAHFLEHMLFSDHDGRTEEEIKGEIENRGGRRNGTTYSDHVSYYATIAKEDGLLALDWIYRIVQPHAMEPEVVDRGRQPVGLEIGIRPREFFDWIGAYVIDPPWLRVKGFWEREFNYETRQFRWYDPHTSLGSITPEDLRAFYDTYYVPSRMTLVVVGDLDRDAVLAQAEETFGTLPAGPEPEVAFDVVDPDRQHREYYWAFQPSVLYDSRFKAYGLTDERHLRMIFIQQLLQYRLNQRLRYGERKAVYGISVSIGLRGPTAYLRINAQINDDEFDFAQSVIAEEIDFLRQASLPEEEFEEVRDTLLTRLIRENRQSDRLAQWAATSFYNPDLHRDFPDLAGFFETITKAELAPIADELFAPERQVLSVTKLQPISQGAFVLVAIAVVVGTVVLAKRLMTTRVEMPRIRYVARFKRPLLYRIIVGTILVVLVASAYRFALQGVILFAERYIDGVDSYLFQYSVIWLVVALGILGIITCQALIPSKLLVFDDHIRVKFRSYRSRRIDFTDLKDLSV